MSHSIIIIGAGFLVALLGAMMIYLSLQAEPESRRGRFGFIGSVIKARESRRLIKFTLLVGVIITGILYAAAWLGIVIW